MIKERKGGDITLKRKYMIIVALATVSILLGSLLYSNLVSGANSSSGSWGIIRFVEPDETVIEVQDNVGDTAWENASRVFIWSPMNSSDNVILSIHWWFEYKTNITVPFPNDYYMNVGLNITCDNIQVLSDCLITYGMMDLNYRQHRNIMYWSVPKNNCSHYQFWFQVRGQDTLPLGPASWKGHVRNLIFIIEVADGIVPNEYYKVELPSVGVGGFWIPLDKLALLTPYFACVTTIILAVSISVAYIKIRKKQ